MSHATHANAALTPRARLKLAKLIVEEGWTIPHALPSATTCRGRPRRSGLTATRPRVRPGCSTGPHVRTTSRTAPREPVVRKIVHLRWKQRLGPVEIADRLGMAVLDRVRRPGPLPAQQAHPHRPRHRRTDPPLRTRQPRRPAPHGRQEARSGPRRRRLALRRPRRGLAQPRGHGHRARAPLPRSKHGKPLIGTCYLHTVIDDHSRVAYVEAHDDETKETAAAVLRNAVAWFAERGVTVQRVLTDNGGCYRSHLWRDTCAELVITPKRTRPYRPQTNGKIERFHRTLVEGWAFKKFYNSESARLAALPAWVHQYNHHRPHSAIGKQSPITRLDNLAGHHS